jgi:hypothetical protein
MNTLRAIGAGTTLVGGVMIAAFAVLYWRAHAWAGAPRRIEVDDRFHRGLQVFDLGGVSHQAAEAQAWFLLALGVAVVVVGLLVLSMARGSRFRPDAG